MEFIEEDKILIKSSNELKGCTCTAVSKEVVNVYSA